MGRAYDPKDPKDIVLFFLYGKNKFLLDFPKRIQKDVARFCSRVDAFFINGIADESILRFYDYNFKNYFHDFCGSVSESGVGFWEHLKECPALRAHQDLIKREFRSAWDNLQMYFVDEEDNK